MIKERIINSSVNLFRVYGVKGMTMDRISKELGISKKTLYEYFPNKDNLIQSCVEYKIEIEKLFQAGSDNLLDDLIHCCKISEGENHRQLYDIYKFYSQTYSYIKNKICDYARVCSEKTKKYQILGYVCDDITKETVEDLIKNYLFRLFVCNGCLMAGDSISNRFQFRIVIRGITTKKGLEYIDAGLLK
jgi:AcrR family transcriptional regulator